MLFGTVISYVFLFFCKCLIYISLYNDLQQLKIDTFFLNVLLVSIY